MICSAAQVSTSSAELDAEILRVWIAERRRILQREGCAVRAGHGHSIEVQIINSPFQRFATLTLPDGRAHFTTAAERDRVLAELQAPQLPEPPAQGVLRFIPFVRASAARL